MLDGLSLADPGVAVPPSVPGAGPGGMAASLVHGLEGILLKHGLTLLFLVAGAGFEPATSGL